MVNFSGLVTDDPTINDESQFGVVISICVSFSVASVFFLGLRLYTRLHVLHYAGVDDATIVVAEALALLTALGAGMEARHGLGRHTWTVAAEDALKQMKWLYFVVMVYNLGTNVIKVSFLLQYRRLFVGERTVLACKCALIFVGLWAIVQVLILALACLPLASIVPSMKGRCLAVDPVWYMSSAMNIVTDFVVFLIPLPTIITMRTKGKRQKVLLLVVFGLGFFTCIISIIRIFSLSKRTQSKDIFWTSVATACWSIVELHCGIICSCLATLQPLLRIFFPFLTSTTQDNVLSFEIKNNHSVLSRRAGDGDDNKYATKTQVGLPTSSSTEALRNGTAGFPLRGGAADDTAEGEKSGAETSIHTLEEAYKDVSMKSSGVPEVCAAGSHDERGVTHSTGRS